MESTTAALTDNAAGAGVTMLQTLELMLEVAHIKRDEGENLGQKKMEQEQTALGRKVLVDAVKVKVASCGGCTCHQGSDNTHSRESSR